MGDKSEGTGDDILGGDADSGEGDETSGDAGDAGDAGDTVYANTDVPGPGGDTGDGSDDGDTGDKKVATGDDLLGGDNDVEGDTGDGDDKKGDDGDSDVPDAYEFHMPEGYALSDAERQVTTGLFKELGLSQTQADKLQQYGFARDAQAATAQAEQMKTLQTSWVRAIRDDTELGGANFENSVMVARRAIEKFGGKEMVQELRSFGADRNDQVFRFLHRIGSAIQEDSLDNDRDPQFGGSASPEGWRDFYAGTMGS